MRGSRKLLVAAILIVAGCRDATGVTEPTVPARLAPDGPSLFVDGRYPTEEEYYDELGDARPVVFADENPTGWFSSDLSTWHARGTLGWRFGNIGWGKLEAEVLHADGSVINSGEDTWSFDQFLPKITAEYRSFNVSISTINNTCDVVGKARLRGDNAAKLVKSGSLLTLWKQTYDRSAPEVTLPPCLEKEEVCEAGFVGGACVEGAGDYPVDENGDGGGMGGSGGGGIDDGSCTVWRWDTYVSRDGGQTWRYESTRYSVEC